MNVTFTGVWNSSIATVLIVVGIVIGAIIYFLGTLSKSRKVSPFVGGEVLADTPEMRVTGTDFYKSISDIGILKFFYKLAKKKVFDIYEVGTKITLWFNKVLRYFHNGVLPTYLAWCLLAMCVLFYVLLKK